MKTAHPMQVLVADVPAGVRTIEKIVGASATVLGASQLTEAVSMLNGVDLVVCGVHFDESRMYDLLRIAKADQATRDIPFVCYRDIDSGLGRPLLREPRHRLLRSRRLVFRRPV